jgi:integrase
MNNPLLELFGLVPPAAPARPAVPVPQVQPDTPLKPPLVPPRVHSAGEYRWGKPIGLAGTGAKLYPYVTPDMAARIIEAIPFRIKQSWRLADWRLFYTTMWQTGLRIGEVLAIEKQDVTPEGLMIHREKKRSPTVDRVPMNAQLYADLAAHIGLMPPRSARLFPYGARRAAQVLKAAAEQAGYDSRCIHPHLFRHGFAVNYLKQFGKDAGQVPALQHLLGHKNAAQTMVYLEPTFDDLQSSIDKMDFGGR